MLECVYVQTQICLRHVRKRPHWWLIKLNRFVYVHSGGLVSDTGQNE